MTSWSKPVHEDFTTIEIANPTPGVEWALADPRIEALLNELATRVADRLDAEGVRYNTAFNAGEASGSLAEAGSVSGLSDIIANLVVERLAVLDRGPEPAALPTSEDVPFDPLSSFAYVPANAAIAESAAPWQGGDGLGRERMGWDAHNGFWDNGFEPVVEAAAVLMPFDHIYVDPVDPALLRDAPHHALHAAGALLDHLCGGFKSGHPPIGRLVGSGPGANIQHAARIGQRAVNLLRDPLIGLS